jgi:pimeloyl-ACP methyl ester carboxylesterase
MSTWTPADDSALVRQLEEVIANKALADSDSSYTAPPSLRRRRGFDASSAQGLATLSLVRDGEILRWHYEPAASVGRATRRRRAGSRPVGTEVLTGLDVKELGANEVTQALERLDAKLTPSQGLRRLANGKLEPVQNFASKGRVLLLVHGTFSKSDMFIDELNSTPEGVQFLAKAQKKYDAVLAFDHPTLSVSPWLNAVDLEKELAGVTGPIDVIAHSRGGLVVAWWLRNAARPVEAVIFVGSPLHGTSLASPARLRAALDMLANVFGGLAKAGAAASTVAPMMAAVTGVTKIVFGVLHAGASLPFADAGVALVPGLAAQSRVRNNLELVRLVRPSWPSTMPKYHAVMSNFVPTPSDEPWWQFWKRFRSWGVMAGDAAIDAIFEGNNDLVVDNDSMAIICQTPIGAGAIQDFGDSPLVHHCNYFRQPKTVLFLARVLKVV